MRKMILIGIIFSVIAFSNCKAVTHNKIKGEERFSTNNYRLTDQSLLPAKDKSFTEGYEGAKWGVSKEQVKDVFSDKEFNIRDKLIWFSDTIAGENVDVIFDFFDDRLYTVNIQVNVRTMGSQAYLSRFFRFKNLLAQKYGEPVQKIRQGSPDPYVSDADAILMGTGIYRSVWHAPESRITLSLQGASYKLHLWAEYECVELVEQKKQRKINS